MGLQGDGKRMEECVCPPTWIWAGLVARKTEVESMCVCVYTQAYKRGRWEVGGGVAIVLLER